MNETREELIFRKNERTMKKESKNESIVFVDYLINMGTI